MKIFFLLLFSVSFFVCYPQAQLVIHGGIMTIMGGAALVIDNSDNNAISQSGGGYIVSEGAENRVIWSVGAGNNGNFIVPFGNANGFLPVSFTAGSGSADGQLVFSTYPTLTWQNSDLLPPGVTDINNGPNDNSAYVIDRFWQIRPLGYSTPPTLQNLNFTYSKSELAAPNTISESGLIAQRWNSTIHSWSDYLPSSTIDVGNSTLTVLTVPGNELYDWWTLVDASSPLPVTLLNFSATPADGHVDTHWQTAIENNSSYFELWRSQSLNPSKLVGTVPAAGTSSNLLNYHITDPNPYPGKSYYKLKEVDLDGKQVWSQAVAVDIAGKDVASLFPNPANSYIIISLNKNILTHPMAAVIYDVSGRTIQTLTIRDPRQKVDISNLAAGIYHMYFIYNQNPLQLDFIKN